MTVKQYFSLLDPVIRKAVAGFDGVLPKTQQFLFAELTRYLSALRLDVAGNILNTPENFQLLIQAINAVISRTLNDPEYLNAVRSYVAAFDQITKISEGYFSAAVAAFNPLDPRLVAAKQAAIVQVTQRMTGLPIQGALSQALTEVLQTSVTSGGSYDDLTAVLRDRLLGAPGNGGVLERYMKTFAHDAIQEFNRSYAQNVAANFKMVFYLYEGGLQDTSRDFCRKREGKFFHEKEIRSWARLDWEGKNPLTTESTIFTYCGGYNCNHQFLPVDSAVVPRAALDRALAEGFLTKEEYDLILQR
ncbi:MAG: hypothetical protein RMM53_09825 [Bacteroidia bacterium]|nr:hypothetical protein [Bacteroidia bacterium]MDW8334500.1 hypothetical protein [Bacteroidia bacterium]